MSLVGRAPVRSVRAAALRSRAAALALVCVAALAACTADPGAAPRPTASPAPSPTAPPPTTEPTSALPLSPQPSGPPTASAPAPAFDRFPAPPDRDLADLAQRFLLKGQDLAPLTPSVVGEAQVGQVEGFWLMDLVAPKAYRVGAALRLVTHHAAWYVVEGVGFTEDALRVVADGFEGQVYPGVTATFSGDGVGLPPDAQITVVVARLRGAAGYFGGADLQPRQAYRYSNERPTLYVDAGTLASSRRGALSLLAHELQHMIHWYADPTEETWVNEGLSELATGVVGLPPPNRPLGADLASVSLTRWGVLSGASGRSYAAAHLFFRYLTEQYGGMEGMGALLEEQADGIAGISAYLKGLGGDATFEDVFLDWTVANLLGSAGSGRFGYRDDGGAVAARAPRRELRPGGAVEGAVDPFAADYVRLDLPPGPAALRFSGDAASRVLPTSPPSGERCWWGNQGDAIHSRLTRQIDLRDHERATLRFRAWHNIESGWDFSFVTASRDGGATWDILSGTHTVEDDAVGVSYGPGLTGASGGWRREEVDLSAYSGDLVLIGFEYVTDDAFNLHGICLDDIEVPEIGFFDDAESDAGWRAEGFVRIANTLPQRFAVRVVTVRSDGSVVVVDLPLDDNTGVLRLDGGREGQESVSIVVSSLTRYSGEAASYTLALE